MKNYIKYRLKQCLLPFAILLAVCMVYYVLPLATFRDTLVNYNYMVWLTTNSFIIGGMCLLAPSWAFDYRMKKRSADLYFALPITRRQLIAVNFFLTFATILAVYTVEYWLGATIMLPKLKEPYANHFLPLFFANIIPMFIIYAISAFAFTRASSVRDGTFLSLVYTVIPFILVYIGSDIICRFIDATELEELISPYITSAHYTSFSPLISVNSLYTAKIMTTESYTIADNELIAMIVMLGIAVIATAYMIIAEKYVKAEDREQPSTSPFGHITIIPLLLFFCTKLFWFVNMGIIMLAIYALSGYAMMAMYMRSPKIGWKNAVIIAVAIILGVIFGY